MRKTIVAVLATVAFVTTISGASALSIEDAVAPNGVVGQAYFFQLRSAPGSGTTPLRWIVPHSGVFPPGLTTFVSSNTRTLTILGVPTRVGVYKFYVQMIDSPGPWVCCTEEEYTIVVKDPDAPAGPGQEANLTESQFPYTGPYYGPDTQNGKPKRKGNTAQALKLVMHQLDLGFFPNPDKHYNRSLQTAMRKFQEPRGIRPTGDYGIASWNEVRKAHKPDGRLAAGQVARLLVNLESGS